MLTDKPLQEIVLAIFLAMIPTDFNNSCEVPGRNLLQDITDQSVKHRCTEKELAATAVVNRSRFQLLTRDEIANDSQGNAMAVEWFRTASKQTLVNLMRITVLPFFLFLSDSFKISGLFG